MDFIKKYKIKCNVLKSDRFTQMVELLEDRTVYKKIMLGYYEGSTVVTLFIPKGTVIHIPVRLRPWGEPKCRAEFAIVKSIEGKLQSAVNAGNCYPATLRKTTYTKNEPVFPHRFDKGLNTCAGGIHFFFSRKDAKDY